MPNSIPKSYGAQNIEIFAVWQTQGVWAFPDAEQYGVTLEYFGRRLDDEGIERNALSVAKRKLCKHGKP